VPLPELAMMKKLSADYPVWLCDIWGVVHNGVAPFANTVDCLVEHRGQGGIVVLVSNSPRSEAGIIRQLDEIGVTRAAYDAAVTSGDVTRTLMAEAPTHKLFHLGPERDISIFHGLAVQRVALAEAGAVICTGLFHDDVETPEDYEALLKDMLARGLPMICANPDKMVRKGARLLFCAGSLAERYAAMGGEVAMAGKPHAPIYELARKKAAAAWGKPVASADVLAIGDGPETDIRGAAGQGIACLYVTGGVRDHASDMDAELAHVQSLVPKAHLVAAVPELVWR
jgi:HAD superfamily hydrolase (TIGR01459 family)